MTRDHRQLYLDCDGVLADFDRGVRELLGMPADGYIARHGAARFCQQLARAPAFYARLPLLPDAMELFDAVRHLHPVILTGLPRGAWAAPQKVQWAARHFPGTRIITCMAVDKRQHAHPGDVLVDDMLKHRQLWEDAGGLFIHHRGAASTLRQLARWFPLAAEAASR